MSSKNVKSAVSYYKSMAGKDIAGMGRHSHLSVRLVSPMDKLTGKKAVLAAAGKLSKMIKRIKVRDKLWSGNQVMLIYDMVFAKPIGVCRTALMTFKNGLIARSPLFFDTRPFGEK